MCLGGQFVGRVGFLLSTLFFGDRQDLPLPRYNPFFPLFVPLPQAAEEDEGVATREEDRAAKVKEQVQSQIKAKSKMSKAEKMEEKKQKAKAFNSAKAPGGASPKAVAKNDKRWN